MLDAGSRLDYGRGMTIDRYDVNDALSALAGGRLSDDDLNDLVHLVSDAIDAGSYCEKCSGPCQEI